MVKMRGEDERLLDHESYMQVYNFITYKYKRILFRF